MKFLFVAITLLTIVFTTKAQTRIGLETIEDIVKNEQEYFNDIVEIYKSDDPYLRTDDIALVYYGEAFKPVSKDSKNNLLKKYYSENNIKELYNTATEILKNRPASLSALFYAWVSAKESGKSEEEALSYVMFSNSPQHVSALSYVNKFNKIVTMIIESGSGKNSESPFCITHPDDQQFIMAALDISNSISSKFDTESLCYIHIIKPTEKFQSSVLYFDLTLFLKKKSME